MRLFYVFPVKRNKIFFSSFEGQTISCNPKYIYKMLRSRYGDTLQYVWECNTDRKCNEKTVKHNSFSYIYHIMTAHIIVTNTGISAVFPLRKKQKCINTWHGSGAYKKVGMDIDERVNGTGEKRMLLSAQSTDFFISGCEKFTQVMSRALCMPKDIFLPIGMPRNDCLVAATNDENVFAIKEQLGIAPNQKVVLYAPTFRGKTDDPDKNDLKLNTDRIIRALSKRFDGEWLFAYRCHYLTDAVIGNQNKCIDVSDYDDMQELLMLADVLISDYSSAIWDYSLTKKPCLLYCYDLTKYKSERDFYTPIEEWGFPIACTEEELINAIETFELSKYELSVRKHHTDLGSFENGKATEKICEVIERFL